MIRPGTAPLIIFSRSLSSITNLVPAIITIESCGGLQNRIPSRLKAKMVSEVALSSVIRLVPSMGLFKVCRCNSLIARFLENHLLISDGDKRGRNLGNTALSGQEVKLRRGIPSILHLHPDPQRIDVTFRFGRKRVH